MLKYEDHNRIICWLEPEHSIIFIRSLDEKLADRVELDTSDDGGVVLVWKRTQEVDNKKVINVTYNVTDNKASNKKTPDFDDWDIWGPKTGRSKG
jgi:hypothetical protein